MLNHLQDCAADYRALDRVYLPRARSRRRGARIEELAARCARAPACAAAIDRLLDGTERADRRGARFCPAAVESAGPAPRMRGHRQPRRAPGAAAATRRSAGDAGQADARRFRGGAARADCGADDERRAWLDGRACEADTRAAIRAQGGRGRAPRSIGRCGCCRRRGARRCSRSMPFAARSTTSPTATIRATAKLAALWRMAGRDRGDLRRHAAIAAAPRARRDRPALPSAARGFPRAHRRHGDGCARSHPRAEPRRARSLLRPRGERRRPSLGAHLRRRFARPPIGSPIPSGARLQLTNILRDLAEDAGARPALSAARAADRPWHRTRPIRRWCCAIRRCRRCARPWPTAPSSALPKSPAAMAQCPRRAMRPAAVMSAVYHALLGGCGGAAGATSIGRSNLPKAVKLWLALRYGLL